MACVAVDALSDMLPVLATASLSVDSETPASVSVAELVVAAVILANELAVSVCEAALLGASVVEVVVSDATVIEPDETSYTSVTSCAVASIVIEPALVIVPETIGYVLELSDREAVLVSVYVTKVTRLTCVSVDPDRISVPSLLTSMMRKLLAPIAPQPIGPLPNAVKL